MGIAAGTVAHVYIYIYIYTYVRRVLKQHQEIEVLRITLTVLQYFSGIKYLDGLGLKDVTVVWPEDPSNKIQTPTQIQKENAVRAPKASTRAGHR